MALQCLKEFKAAVVFKCNNFKIKTHECTHAHIPHTQPHTLQQSQNINTIQVFAKLNINGNVIFGNFPRSLNFYNRQFYNIVTKGQYSKI
jgi:hypothetical protein